MFLGLTLLLFTVDFIEIVDDAKKIENALAIAVQIVLYRIPNFLEILLPFMIYLSSLFVFYRLSNNDEITIVRTASRSLLQIVSFPAFAIFLFGVFIVLFYSPFASYLKGTSEDLMNIHLRKQETTILESEEGFWFKQKNTEEGGIIIIRIGGVYKNSLSFTDVMLVFLDGENNFVQKILAEKAEMDGVGNLIASNNYIFSKKNHRIFKREIKIPTDLKKDFVAKVIQGEFASVYNILFWNLLPTIKSLKEAGLNYHKFVARFCYLVLLPFIFGIMCVISSYFGIVHSRDNKKYMRVIKGIVAGFSVFMLQNLINQMVIARKLGVFDSILVVLIFVLFAGILLIKKEYLANFVSC
jgi:lipopolysaccharide export LptBFGC system permease protein LptF